MTNIAEMKKMLVVLLAKQISVLRGDVESVGVSFCATRAIVNSVELHIHTLNKQLSGVLARKKRLPGCSLLEVFFIWMLAGERVQLVGVRREGRIEMGREMEVGEEEGEEGRVEVVHL